MEKKPLSLKPTTVGAIRFSQFTSLRDNRATSVSTRTSSVCLLFSPYLLVFDCSLSTRMRLDLLHTNQTFQFPSLGLLTSHRFSFSGLVLSPSRSSVNVLPSQQGMSALLDHRPPSNYLHDRDSIPSANPRQSIPLQMESGRWEEEALGALRETALNLALRNARAGLEAEGDNAQNLEACQAILLWIRIAEFLYGEVFDLSGLPYYVF